MAAKVREKAGQHWVFVNHQGQRRAKQVGPGKSGKKLADALARQWNAALVLGDVDKVFPPKVVAKPTGSMPTLREMLPAWLEQREKRGDLRGGSGPAYFSAARTWLLPTLGDVPVEQITREQIGEAIRKCRDAGRSRSTVGMIVKAVRPFFADLVETKQIPANPAENLRHFTGKMKTSKKVGIFTKDECQQILRAAEGTRQHAFVATALGTGARWGELTALTKDDVDLKGQQLLIHASWSRVARKVLDTKTGKDRVVPMSKGLTKILRAWLEVRAAEGWGEGQIVFPGNSGRHLQTWAKTWSTLLRRAKVAYRNFHATRHTYISHALKAGIRPDLVQQWAGHSSLVMTLGTYGKFIPNSQADARDAEKLGDLVC